MILQRSIDLYSWILLHQIEFALWGIVLFSVCCVLAIVVVLGRAGWRLWRDHEIYKRVERDLEARRIYEAAHRIPKPFSEPASQGFDRSKNRLVS